MSEVAFAKIKWCEPASLQVLEADQGKVIVCHDCQVWTEPTGPFKGLPTVGRVAHHSEIRSILRYEHRTTKCSELAFNAVLAENGTRKVRLERGAAKG